MLARKAQCREGLCFLQPPPPPSYHSMIPFHRCGVGSDRCAKIEPSATWHAMKLVCGCTRSFLRPTTLVSVQSNIHPPPFSPQETRSGSLARERLRGGLALNPQPRLRHLAFTPLCGTSDLRVTRQPLGLPHRHDMMLRAPERRTRRMDYKSKHHGWGIFLGRYRCRLFNSAGGPCTGCGPNARSLYQPGSAVRSTPGSLTASTRDLVSSSCPHPTAGDYMLAPDRPFRAISFTHVFFQRR
jgi:hypothetical protein